MEGVNYKQWGMYLVHEDKDKKIYIQRDLVSKHLFFKVYPGIEIMLCSFDSDQQWGGQSYQIPDYFQISYSHNGIVQMELEKDRLSYIDPGDIYVIQNAKRSYHGMVLTPNYRGFNILITPANLPDSIKATFEAQFGLGMDQLYKKICQNPIFFKLKSFDHAVHISEELYGCLLEENMGMIRLKTIELFLLMLKTDFNHFHVYQAFSNKNIVKTKAIKEYMETHISAYITIEQLCSRFDITPTLFKNCFRELFHHPPHEYLIKVRMAKAAELLEDTNQSILTIAKKTGYKNTSNFARAFKNMYKITPTQYREAEMK